MRNALIEFNIWCRFLLILRGLLLDFMTCLQVKCRGQLILERICHSDIVHGYSAVNMKYYNGCNLFTSLTRLTVSHRSLNICCVGCLPAFDLLSASLLTILQLALMSVYS